MTQKGIEIGQKFFRMLDEEHLLFNFSTASLLLASDIVLCTYQCSTEIRYRYQEPKPGLNFGIGIGAITFSEETKIAFSTNFDFCLMAD